MPVVSYISTEHFLGTEQMASSFFDLLGSLELLPDKIGLYEPLREPFDRHRAMEMFLQATRYEFNLAGGMMGKKAKPKYDFDILWRKGPKAGPNTISLVISDGAFRKERSKFADLFKRLFAMSGGIFGFMTAELAFDRQVVSGSLETRLPGVFWMTAFGQPYIDFFGGVPHLQAGPWRKSELITSDKLLVALADDPFDEQLLDTPILENAAKSYLGIDSFGDLELYLQQPRVPQIRRVPSLHLPEIEVEI